MHTDVSAGHRLREMLKARQVRVLPGVYDCLSARLAEQMGFELLFTSGFGISAATLGKPDYGFLTATEMLAAAGRIADSVQVPVVADLDTGYGNPLNVMRTVREAVRLGVAGIILEDQEWPKKCGHFDGKRIISPEEHVEKIRAAVEARGDSHLVVVARTDARASLGLEEALRRARAYREAGADVLFVEAPQSVQELEIIASSFPGVPLLANMIEGGKTPLLSARQLEDLGFQLVAFPLTGLFASARALQHAFLHLKEQGTSQGLPALYSFQEFETLMDVPAYRLLEQKFRVSPRD